MLKSGRMPLPWPCSGLIDNPHARWYAGTLYNPTGPAVADSCDTSVVVDTTGSLQNLVNCGYLAYRQYLDGNFGFAISNYNGPDGPDSSICMWGTSGKLASAYKGTYAGDGYRYCTHGEDGTETFGE